MQRALPRGGEAKPCGGRRRGGGLVNYDKNSFLAGVAVGRQLKGWGQSAGQARCPRADLETVFRWVLFSTEECAWSGEAA